MRRVLDIRTATVAVELTSRCNLRCGMCPMDRLDRAEQDMPWWLVEKVAAELGELGVAVGWLHEMGEPLLYPRLAEAIELFPGCSVSTNVVRLDRERAKELLATSLRRIRLCLDTVDRDLYPTLRRGADFDQVVANIRTFLELSRGCDIAVEIQRMISLQTAHETVRQFEELFELDRFPHARVVEKTCEGLDTSAATDHHQAFHGCFQGYPFRYFIVLADGRVTHCCYDFSGLQAIGDLTRQTVREVLASATIDRFMEAFRDRDWHTLPRCGECYRDTSPRAQVLDNLQRLGHRLDRFLPVKQIARRIINR